MALVSGYSLVPDPPAKIIPFILKPQYFFIYMSVVQRIYFFNISITKRVCIHIRCLLLRRKNSYKVFIFVGILSTFKNFSAESFHFRYGSATPCPALRVYVTCSTSRTRYMRLAIPYPTIFSFCTSVSLQRLLM